MTTARMAIELYWRFMKASAPSRIASEIMRISGVPESLASTLRAKTTAATSESNPTASAIHRKMFPERSGVWLGLNATFSCQIAARASEEKKNIHILQNQSYPRSYARACAVDHPSLRLAGLRCGAIRPPHRPARLTRGLQLALKGVIRAWRENDGQCELATYLAVTSTVRVRYGNPRRIALQSCFIEHPR